MTRALVRVSELSKQVLGVIWDANQSSRRQLDYRDPRSVAAFTAIRRVQRYSRSNGLHTIYVHRYPAAA